MDTLFPNDGHSRSRESNQEAMMCFEDNDRHGRRNQDRIFLAVRSVSQRPQSFLGPSGLYQYSHLTLPGAPFVHDFSVVSVIQF